MAILAKRNDAWELSERKKERGKEREREREREREKTSERKRFTDVSHGYKGPEYISVPGGAIIYKIHVAQSRQA